MSIYDIIFINATLWVAIMGCIAVLTNWRWLWSKPIGIINLAMSLYWFFYISFAGTRFFYHFIAWITGHQH